MTSDMIKISIIHCQLSIFKMSPLFFAVGASGKGCCKPLRAQRYNKKMTYANFMSFFFDFMSFFVI